MSTRNLLLYFLLFQFQIAFAQITLIKGYIFNQESDPISNVKITYLEKSNIVASSENGYYEIIVEPGTATLQFEAPHFKVQKKIITINANEIQSVDIHLELEIIQLKEIIIEGNHQKEDERAQVSTLKIDPKAIKYLPSAFGDFNKILATVGLGVVSNSELSSQYTVRGGNFDENLIYVNGMEVYRPFLVRSGQQEGLSFINPDMVSDIEFSAGGWQAKYGDKLSSVLNVNYRQPKRFKGSATAGLLGFSMHIENQTKNKRITYIIGARNKNSTYLLNTLPTKGEYRPRFYDVQSLITLDLTKRRDSSDFENRTTLSLLTSYANNHYSIMPTKSQTTFGTLGNAIRIDVLFDGKELMDYSTIQNSLKLHKQINKKLGLDFLTSYVQSIESEELDIESIYKLCEIETAQNAANFNQCILEKGAGSTFRHARNELKVKIFTISHQGQWKWNEKHDFIWGVSENNEQINDALSEYAFEDSVQYVTLTDNIKSKNELNTFRTQGFVQDTWYVDSIQQVTLGARFNYWTFTKQLLVSPRLQYSIKPKWRRDIILKASAGVYQQSPFYREMRNYTGIINASIRAQESYHFILGSDYVFRVNDRRFKFISEIYYKHLEKIIPYDMDNVRLRYYGENNAKGFARGIDMRVSGEFIKGEESWFSLSLLDTKEDVADDNRGYIRRPTDQRVTAGIFFQDHIPNNPSLKMFLNLVYGSGLPFGPPKSQNYRSYFSGPMYNRVDIGFSKLITFNTIEKNKPIKSIWISLEVLNLLGARNTISYTWVKDFSANEYAVPNTLSTRFLNIRIIGKF